MLEKEKSAYLKYVEFMRRCTLEEIDSVTEDDVVHVQDALRKDGISHGVYKIGTIVMDRAKRSVRYELENLNRVIDELKP